jgi:hypothetical protein
MDKAFRLLARTQRDRKRRREDEFHAKRWARTIHEDVDAHTPSFGAGAQTLLDDPGFALLDDSDRLTLIDQLRGPRSLFGANTFKVPGSCGVPRSWYRSPAALPRNCGRRYFAIFSTREPSTSI